VQAIEQKAIPGAHLLLEVMRAAALKQRHDMTVLLAGESGKQAGASPRPIATKTCSFSRLCDSAQRKQAPKTSVQRR
jgi:hypothetical protein